MEIVGSLDSQLNVVILAHTPFFRKLGTLYAVDSCRLSDSFLLISADLLLFEGCGVRSTLGNGRQVESVPKEVEEGVLGFEVQERLFRVLPRAD